MLLRSAPWASQPQTKQGIDRSSPLGAALDFVWTGLDLAGVDSISGFTVKPPSAVFVNPTALGLALSSASFAGGTNVAIPKPFAFPYVQVGYGYFGNGANNHTLSGLTGAVGTYNSNIQLASNTDVRVQVQFNGTARTIAVTLPTSRNTPICAIFVAYSDTDYRLFVNGLQASGTLSPGTGTSFNRVQPAGASCIGGVWASGFGFGRSITDADALAITANPEGLLWQMFAPQQIYIPAAASGGVTVSATVGNAVADGITASVDQKRSIAATPGNAAADGATAVVDQKRTVSATPGNAVADGVAATVDQQRTIAGLVGNAVADGVAATVTNGSTVVITAIPGDAVADGVTAAILQDVTISATPGGAVADGVLARILNASTQEHYSGGWFDHHDRPRKKKKEQPEVIQILEAAAQAVAVEQVKPNQAAVAREVRAKGYAFKDAYKEIYKQLIAEKLQEQEDEMIVHAIAEML